MRKEEFIKQLQERAPLLADAVNHMVTYVQDRYPSAFPSKEQTEAVNSYLRSIRADGDRSISEWNCGHRRIASQNITIAAIRILDSRQLDRLQGVLDHTAYDKEYYMPERGYRMHRWLSLLAVPFISHLQNWQTMKTNLNYCIVLSSEQLAYLAGSRYGIDRMKILHQPIEAAMLEENDYAIKGFPTTSQVGQAILSEVGLSCKLDYDKKTISRVLDKMNQLGIVASTRGNRASVHTLKYVSAWMSDDDRIGNPFYVRIRDQQEKGEDDCSQSEAMNEGRVSDSDFSFTGEMPVISNNGGIPSPLISISSRSVVEEESNENISVDSQI